MYAVLLWNKRGRLGAWNIVRLVIDAIIRREILSILDSITLQNGGYYLVRDSRTTAISVLSVISSLVKWIIYKQYKRRRVGIVGMTMTIYNRYVRGVTMKSTIVLKRKDLDIIEYDSNAF